MKPVCLVCGTVLEGGGYNGCCSQECARAIGRLSDSGTAAFGLTVGEAVAIELGLVAVIPLLEMKAARQDTEGKLARSYVGDAASALAKVRRLLATVKEELDESRRAADHNDRH